MENKPYLQNGIPGPKRANFVEDDISGLLKGFFGKISSYTQSNADVLLGPDFKIKIHLIGKTI